jgi:hypothetical protein
MWVLTICAAMQAFVSRVKPAELIVQISAVISMLLTFHLLFLLLLFLDLTIQFIDHTSPLMLDSLHALSLCLHADIKRWGGCGTFSELTFHYVS